MATPRDTLAAAESGLVDRANMDPPLESAAKKSMIFKECLRSTSLAFATIFAGVPKGRAMVDSSVETKPENANGPYGSYWLSKC